ncbi:MAG TPA: formate dehydrogenase subunit alpha [Candidatus Acidoferrales bacterium]|nr:formate dehydrogenase subunit alpha [Candidatus Acidoferrales bacterium]
MLHVAINGKPGAFAEGISILHALRSAGIEVPTLCHDDRLKPYGGCRLCVVQVKGWPRPVTACNTPLEAGMEIETHSPEIENARRTLLALLAHDSRPFAIPHRPEKEFHKVLRLYDIPADRDGGSRNVLPDDSHPYIRVDMSQCIHCYRCVRICNEVQGQFVWQVWNRGDRTVIRPDSGTTLLESGCVSCGACVDTCPTGALEDNSILSFGTPTSWTRTTCPYCGTGCEMFVGLRENRIVSVRPASDAPVSRGHLCVKGRYAFEFVHSPSRVTQPMIRVGQEWKRVSWDEAIQFTAGELRRIVTEHGSDAVGVLGSARATNEENYLAQKFARVVLGTNNVDCCARVCHAPSAAALKTMLGTGAATNSFADIERARTILVCGANSTENHPIVGARIKQAALRGAHLIVIDPRRIELARYADCHLQLRPGTNVPLLNAMACSILQEGLCDEQAMRHRIADGRRFEEFIREWPAERAEKICGVEAGLIRKAARLYAVDKPAMCFHGLGVTEHSQGTEGVMCLVNLALLTGNIGKPGTGVNPLRGQNNVQGAAHMGCDPKSLTGSISLEDGGDIFQRAWDAPIPPRKGLNLMEMMDAARRGTLKALWAIGYDVFLTNPRAHETGKALRSLECVIVQDMFLNETAKEFGTVFLPAASSFEKDGTFMNAERRIQRVRKAIDPLGQSRPDWKILCDIAAAMGSGAQFDFHSPEEIWNEVRSVWKAGAGISYTRLEHGGLQWPCPSEDHPGTDILHADAFSAGERARLRPVDYTSTSEKVSDEFPFVLNSGRTFYQFNAGTMTMRTANASLRPVDCLQISPADAERLSLQDEERVRVRSHYGEAVLPVQIDSGISPGELFATFHSVDVFLNFLTGPRQDPFTGTPEYKVTAVQLEKI